MTSGHAKRLSKAKRAEPIRNRSGVELYKIRVLGLPVECERLILGGNAGRLILSRDIGRCGTSSSIRFPMRKDDERGALKPVQRVRMTTLGEQRIYD
jgi:hypothetical protein